MTTCTEPSAPDLASDAFDEVRAQHPRLFADLAHQGYVSAGLDVLGRCHGACTLFLEVCRRTGVVRGWVWDPVKFRFVGTVCEVSGPTNRALVRARQHIEAVYSEDLISGSALRHEVQVVEQLHVD